MKLKLPVLFRGSVAALFIGFLSFAISGCTKEEEDHAAKFNGSWSGTASCGGGASGSGTMVFTATDKKTVTTTYSVGGSGCVQAKVLSGTANGNTVTFNTTTVTDGCGLSYSINGVGTISGSTMTFTITVNGAVNANCTYNLSK